MKPGRWLRFYEDVPDDPKIARLSDALYRQWTYLLCIASRNDGRIPPDLDDVAHTLRKPAGKVREIIRVLLNARLLEPHPDEGWAPHNWNERQYKTDKADNSNAERQRRYRDRHNGNHNANGSGPHSAGETVTTKRPEAEPETESETQTETEQRQNARSADADDAFALAVDAYNRVAKDLDWPVAQAMTDPRRRKLHGRLRECGGIEGWRIAMEKAAQSRFLRGETGRDKAHAGWTPSLDFFLQQSSFTKLMEGRYDDRDSRAEPDGFAAVVAGARAAAHQ